MAKMVVQKLSTGLYALAKHEYISIANVYTTNRYVMEKLRVAHIVVTVYDFSGQHSWKSKMKWATKHLNNIHISWTIVLQNLPNGMNQARIPPSFTKECWTSQVDHFMQTSSCKHAAADFTPALTSNTWKMWVWLRSFCLISLSSWIEVIDVLTAFNTIMNRTLIVLVQPYSKQAFTQLMMLLALVKLHSDDDISIFRCR